MTTYEKITLILRENKIDYEEIRHEEVRTSEEAVKTRPGLSLSQGAKALITKAKDKDNHEFFIMLVMPGDKRFDSKKVKSLLNLRDIKFASEQEVLDITNGVKPGGVPPFGNLFGLKVYVDTQLFENKIIAFNAGDRSISIIMGVKDWKNLVNPKEAEIC